MSAISVSDLRKKPAEQWLKSASKEDLVVTAKGQPVALLLRVTAESLGPTRALLKSVRTAQAQAARPQGPVLNSTSDLSTTNLDAEIAASRRARRRK